MPFPGKPLAVALGVALLSGTVSVPLASAQPGTPVPAPAVEAQPAIAPAPLPPVDEAPAPVAEIDADELDCLAKVVLHEAGNQSRTGQLAVAQVVMNRVRSPRFPDTVCGVVMQRGQFFNVHAYHPRRDSRWRTAVEVARDALSGASEPVIGGALFFHAASAGPFRRTRVGRIGDHVFYR
ncbi:MAG TPA: cell wall hydrolase [Allosphingosinicella sp.]|nr:cell wall hydrolase [Allosphingosinicella sp.]